ncbi:uncharacterized protein EI90DRAFT_2694816 [Cantharellus anzutake]|uniref:uncharacterized protein n=1 Tax=Cantharellus anzutake TaxID=1750568 RepID=UPI001904BEE4|nr:uncharacterized protein EI90DRAFT_2694816 [Cantharellus anzutake]KAF8318818.1 hypothetical protein EI90DRAFT_2694816 [Cantharellus anzutake]
MEVPPRSEPDHVAVLTGRAGRSQAAQGIFVPTCSVFTQSADAMTYFPPLPCLQGHFPAWYSLAFFPPSLYCLFFSHPLFSPVMSRCSFSCPRSADARDWEEGLVLRLDRTCVISSFSAHPNLLQRWSIWPSPLVLHGNKGTSASAECQLTKAPPCFDFL